MANPAGGGAQIENGGADPNDLGFDIDDLHDIQRVDSQDFYRAAMNFQESLKAEEKQKKTSKLLTHDVLGNQATDNKHKGKKGAFAGVFVPTCENMWGVLIFLRFFYIVGHAGVSQALAAVFLSFSCAFCTTSSMSATVSSGGIVSKGGPYYMISRALGPCVGASVGVMYWLAITMLAVLECLGAVEGILMGWPSAEFPFCRQVYGSGCMLSLVVIVWGGISMVSKMGIFFIFIVFSTLFMFYYGLLSCPVTATAAENPWVTGTNFETLMDNWSPHYGEGVSFGVVLSVFFPCFTGILSGANRADVLRDPPKNLRQGTFGAIIFSLFMYSSFMILWGSVADYKYLQGMKYEDVYATVEEAGRRLAGGGGPDGKEIIRDIVWNPFPKAAILGIIISSLSQALQCLCVAPRLLQALAQDRILAPLNGIAPLSKSGEPVRALWVTYLVGGAMVLLGRLDLVAPLLGMCFLVAYMFMNLSCFTLTILKSPAWRPAGIHRKRWRLWYKITSGSGVCICLTIMFTISVPWAIAALCLASTLYFYVSWKIEEQGWGSAMDGIRFQLALNSLIQLESQQNHKVNWRPQVLILYKLNIMDELKGIRKHEILSFYSQLRKVKGFCMVACVLEGDLHDEHAIHKAQTEKDIIQSIMKYERIEGFSEVVVAPSWAEGASYIIQLTGIGGMTPNTVLIDWPEDWREHPVRATDFSSVLNTALAADKAVLAVKGLSDIPMDVVHGTIDIWWIIHDGGFLILLCWLLVQHRVWRQCHLRVFTVTEGVSPEKAERAGELLTKTLRQRRLFDVEVEVILIDEDTVQACGGRQRTQDRHKFLKTLYPQENEEDMHRRESIPFEIEDLLRQEEEIEAFEAVIGKGKAVVDPSDKHHSVTVSDYRKGSKSVSVGQFPGEASRNVSPGANADARTTASAAEARPRSPQRPAADTSPRPLRPVAEHEPGDSKKGNGTKGGFKAVDLDSIDTTPVKASGNSAPREHAGTDESLEPARTSSGDTGVRLPLDGDTNVVNLDQMSEGSRSPCRWERKRSVVGTAFAGTASEPVEDSGMPRPEFGQKAQAFKQLNEIVKKRSKRAQLVVMNLPDQWGKSADDAYKFMECCDTLTEGLDRVLFVHSSGHEVFDITS
eukprot:TRINITY_DN8013_c0_g1_i1.p1 TRINITY_DN8013_c0_g1~~TRINITY_DN8013_c0_g1_i1.p1  ORF type:complete len:1128 (+),score=266.09 TRINITY_DN8013_c0_g1_i1:221-3604(+)